MAAAAFSVASGDNFDDWVGRLYWENSVTIGAMAVADGIFPVWGAAFQIAAGECGSGVVDSCRMVGEVS